MRDFAPSHFSDVSSTCRDIDVQTNVEVHLLYVRKVLTLMREHKLYTNLKMCIFAAIEIPLLGCIVGEYGVLPDPEKTKAITEWPAPTHVKGN